jgi:hypothetical protein
MKSGTSVGRMLNTEPDLWGRLSSLPGMEQRQEN